MPPASPVAVCDSGSLKERGDGIRFELDFGGERLPAFAIRIDGVARAYLNRCSHVPIELDWIPGRFLDPESMMILCATHGAQYDPRSGRCLGGPCRGQGLQRLGCEERDGMVWIWAED
ncbi:MAG: Rieske 2Fe-2S domain-containing protein [Burkholderiaceae bacterium]